MDRNAGAGGDRLVELRLGSDDVTRIRFGISPSHELNLAVRALAAPSRHPLLWGG